MKSRFQSLFRSVLPGIAMVGFTVGTGSVTAMAKAGADYGMSLLWALLLSCIVSCLLFTAFGRLSVVSGKGALEVIRSHIHPALALFILLSVAIGVSISVMGVMGIIADVLYQWSLTWSDEGLPPLVWASVLSLLIFVVLLSGTVKSVERLLAVLAGVMGVCFLLNAVIAGPSAAEVLSGFRLRIPGDDGSRTAGEGYLVAASIVGTTVAPVLFLFRSILIREEGWDAEKMAVQRRDAVVSAILIFLISGAVMASAAGSLHADGVTLDEARDMITLLEPTAGTAAVLVFVIGIAAAGMSSQFPNVISIPWLRRDYQGRSVNLRDPVDRTMILLIAMLGLVVPIIHARPVWIMVMSQALGAIVLPVTVLSVWYLLNNTRLMGAHVLGRGANAALALVSLFSLVMASIGLYGVFEQFRS